MDMKTVKSDVSTQHRSPAPNPNSVTQQRQSSSMPTGGAFANLTSRRALDQGGVPSNGEVLSAPPMLLCAPYKPDTHYLPLRALGHIVGGSNPRLDPSRHPVTISNDQSTKPMSTRRQQPPRQMPPPVGILSLYKSKISKFFGKVKKEWNSSYSASRGGGLAAYEGSSEIRLRNDSDYED